MSFDPSQFEQETISSAERLKLAREALARQRARDEAKKAEIAATQEAEAQVAAAEPQPAPEIIEPTKMRTTAEDIEAMFGDAPRERPRVTVSEVEPEILRIQREEQARLQAERTRKIQEEAQREADIRFAEEEATRKAAKPPEPVKEFDFPPAGAVSTPKPIIKKTLTGTLIGISEKGAKIAEARRKEGDILTAIGLGASSQLVSLGAGLAGAGESLLELVGGEDVPDIGGALIGSGIESVTAGEVRSTAELEFLKTNPFFLAGAVLGEIVVGVGIGKVLKVGGEVVAKGAAKFAKVGEGTKVASITDVPIKIVEKLGVGGSKAEKITTVTQKGEIIQITPGERVAKIVTTIEAKPTKLTFREAQKIKEFAKKTEAIGIEVFGKEAKGIKVGQEGLVEIRKGLFEFTGPGVTKRVTGRKRFKTKTGLEDITVQREKIQQEIIDVASNVKVDFTSRRSRALKAIDEFTSITTKRTAETDIAGLRKLDKITVFDETAAFKQAAKKFDTIEIVNKKFVFEEALKKFDSVQVLGKKPSVKGLSLLEKTGIDTAFTTVGKTRKVAEKIPKKERILDLLNPFSKKPIITPKFGRTTITTKGTIKGARTLEDVIRFQRKGKAKGIIGRQIKKGDPIFELPPIKKPPKIPKTITLKPKPRIKVPSEITVIRPQKPLKPVIGRKIVKGKQVVPKKTVTKAPPKLKPKTKPTTKIKPIIPKSVKRVTPGIKGGISVIEAGKLIGARKPRPPPKVARVGIIEDPFPLDSTIIDTPPGVRDEPFVIEDPIIDTGRKDVPAGEMLERPDFPIGRPKPRPKQPTKTFPSRGPKIGEVLERPPFPVGKPRPRPTLVTIPFPEPRPTPITTPFPKPRPTPTPGPDPGVFPFPKPGPTPDVTPFPFPKPRPRPEPTPTEQPKPKPRPFFDIIRITPTKKRLVALPPRKQKRRTRFGVRERFGRKRFVNPLAEVEDVLGVGSRRTRKRGKGKSLGNLNFF